MIFYGLVVMIIEYIFQTLGYLPLKGRVSLKNPDTTLFYIEYYGQDPNSNPDKPEDLFFGRWVIFYF